MKWRLYFILVVLIYFSGCSSKPGNDATDGTQSADSTVSIQESGDLLPEQARVNRFLEDFNLTKESLPSISYLKSDEINIRSIRYYLEDDNVVFIHLEEASEGGYSEHTILHRDPEGETVLNYSSESEGFFGYTGMQTSEWFRISITGNDAPEVIGPGEGGGFEYQKEFKTHLYKVTSNKNKFKLENGLYRWYQKQEKYKGEYGNAEMIELYEVSEVLFTANLLSETRFDPELIKGYVGWWYPLYESVTGGYERHTVCDEEIHIKIIVEAGNYRWVEQSLEDALGFTISGFQESEGDAFNATLTNNAGMSKRTLVFDEKSDLIFIDGRVYTAEPEKFKVVNENSNCY